tara:strand:+ start:145 stop:978 length:834 start_codon:yes stop_codon:yes gene_type:complete
MARINPLKFLQHLPSRIGVFISTLRLERANRRANKQPALDVDTSLKVAVLLLTWKRPESLKKALETLSIQTYTDFTLFISNANEEIIDFINSEVKPFEAIMDINVIHTSNERKGFRRFDLSKKLHSEGYDTIMFIDDDVRFSARHVEAALSQYEPKSYKSWWAWRLNGKPYKLPEDRTRVEKLNERVDYCGTGVSIMDISIFSHDALFDYPQDALHIEDLWLSYFADHVLGWKLEYLDVPNVILGGGDEVALYLQIQDQPTNKETFVEGLRERGWKV